MRRGLRVYRLQAQQFGVRSIFWLRLHAPEHDNRITSFCSIKGLAQLIQAKPKPMAREVQRPSCRIHACCLKTEASLSCCCILKKYNPEPKAVKLSNPKPRAKSLKQMHTRPLNPNPLNVTPTALHPEIPPAEP